MPENEQKANESKSETIEKLEDDRKILMGLLKEAMVEIKLLKERLYEYEKPLESYYEGWSWLTKIVFILGKMGKPMRSAEIFAWLKKKDTNLDNNADPEKFISVVLTEAKRDKRLLTYKVAGVRGNYYCLPEWMDEDGNLIEEMKRQIDWYVMTIDRKPK